MLILFTDTDCDATPENIKKYGYHLISMPYSPDGKTLVCPYEDYETLDFHAFYDNLRAGQIPSTSAIGKERYIQYFEPFFRNGDDILYVHFSSALSATFGAMRQAVDELREKYPAAGFYTVDTKGITTISYAIVKAIGEMVLAGKTVEEILEWAKTEVDHFAQYFFADDLRFFRRSGRVSGLAAMMGTLIGIRPIIYMSPDGKMESIGKVKGRYAALEHLIGKLDELGDRPEEYPIYIGHTDAPELVAELERLIREKYPDKELNIEAVCVNPTSGAHAGPDSVSVCFHAHHR